MKSRSFQSRLILLIAAVLALLQTATLVAIHVSGRQNVRKTIAEELEVGERVLERLLASRGRQLSNDLRVVASDFAFRQAIATDHQPTIRSVLQNHGARISADVAFLVSLDGIVVAETANGSSAGEPFPFSSLMAETEPDAATSGLVTIDGRAYQLVAVPVLAPQPIAWVSMGRAIDNSFIDEIRRLTSIDVSLIASGETDPVLISTLEEPERLALLDSSPSLLEQRNGETVPLTLGGEPYQVLTRSLETVDGSAIDALLQRSIEEAQRPFQRLELQIFGLSSLALLVAAFAAVVVARGISRPLQRLAGEAAKIERGDYSASLMVHDRDEIGRLASSFNRMRAAIAEREEQIRHQATHDDLTSLPNRTLFLDRLERAISSARRSTSLVGMIMMDLDRFKEINDTLGHHFGDEVLTEVGRRLTETLRESDTVARLGGDEFAVTFFAPNLARAEEVARRIQLALDEPLELGGVAIEIRASMGIALFPLHAGDAATLMKRADVAMYDSKKHHRPFSIYEPGRDEHSLRRLAILSELRNAVASGELELYFQPKIDMTTRKAIHAEALVRWRHPVHGVLSPAEFIPLAEQSGNISMITSWVLRNAIRHCAGWQKEGFDLSVAVNLSALDLFDSELPMKIHDLLAETALSPSKLVLEITESAIMRDPELAMGVLREMKDNGITIAIDDYGTGYSSLSHLKQLPVDELKIDKSFVLSLKTADSEDGVIIRSTIDLGHTMGLKVIAEGVETAESWEILEGFGCDMAQGYYISRPLAAEDFHAWIRDPEWPGEGSQA